MEKTKRQADARELAWQTLVAVERGGFADAELGRRLSRIDLAPRDRALATRLVYGTLAWQGYLDRFIDQLVRSPGRLETEIRVLLRMAFFQLTKLSRVPDFAAVDTAVEFSKRAGREAAARMVNAVLRRFLRERDALPHFPEEPLASALAAKLSHPVWLVERWLNELGREETEALLAANNEAAPTVLRVNRLRIERDALVERLKEAGVAARPTSFARDGIVLEFGADPETLPGYREGLFSVQGEASQLVCSLVGATPSGRVLDACAGPGGKATYLGEMIGLGGLVVALDIERYGLRRLASEARRLGLKCIFACQADSVSAPLRQRESFDAVLVDAPCSGLGTLRQHPEIRWRRTAQDLETLAEKQLALLDASARWVRRGGTLVYATCTIARIENEAVVQRFLEHTPEFRIENAKDLVSPSARSFVDHAGALRTFPHRNGLDGFYAVRMRRE